MIGFFKRPSDNRGADVNSGATVGAGKTKNIAAPHIQPPFNETVTIFGINGKFLHGVLCGAVAWWCWPTDPKWWGFGMFSVILWAASVCFIIEGVRSFINLRGAKKRWRVIGDMGGRPKNARVATKADWLHKSKNP